MKSSSQHNTNLSQGILMSDSTHHLHLWCGGPTPVVQRLSTICAEGQHQFN